MERIDGDLLPIEIMARREDFNDGISLYIRQKIHGVGMSVAKPAVMEPFKRGDYVEPFLRINIQSAQQLIDELWLCGLRPSEGTGSAGSLRATEKHLNDMRKIVGKQLDVKLENDK